MAHVEFQHVAVVVDVVDASEERLQAISLRAATGSRILCAAVELIDIVGRETGLGGSGAAVLRTDGRVAGKEVDFMDTEALVVGKEVFDGPGGVVVPVVGERVLGAAGLDHIAVGIVTLAAGGIERLGGVHVEVVGEVELVLEAIVDVDGGPGLSVEEPFVVVAVAVGHALKRVLHLLGAKTGRCVGRTVDITEMTVGVHSGNSGACKPRDVAHHTTIAGYIDTWSGNLAARTEGVHAE